MKHLLKTVAVGAAAATLASAAQAAPIETAIGLSLDGSGSISSSDFSLQTNAYASVLGNSSILPADGSVVVYVNQFSSSAQTESDVFRISSESDRNELISDINAINQIGGGTDIGDGINDAAMALDNYFGGIADSEVADDFRAIIDVSTDGQSSSGAQAAQDAVNGVGLSNIVFDQVNCLGVGPSANCGFIPPGSFSETANDFDAFRDSLKEKIGRELGTTTPVPAPPVAWLFGLAAVLVIAARARTSRYGRAL